MRRSIAIAVLTIAACRHHVRVNDGSTLVGTPVTIVNADGVEEDASIVQSESGHVVARTEHADYELGGVQSMTSTKRLSGAVYGALAGMVIGYATGFTFAYVERTKCNGEECVFFSSPGDEAREIAPFGALAGVVVGAIVGAFVGDRTTYHF